MPKGGKRVGAGRKKRTATVLAMPGVVVSPGVSPSADAASSSKVEPPARVLGRSERVAWNRMAPAAIERGTLTKNTAHGFALLCQCVVRRDQLERRIEKDGWTYDNQFGEPKRHPLWGVWQVVTLRVEQQLARFGLNGDGKPVPSGAQAEENPWAAIANR